MPPGGRPAAAQESGKLRLVTPPEGEAAAATPESSGRVESQIDSLSKDIAEQRRLLELRNQELADLQSKLADSRAEEEAAAKPAPEPVAPPPSVEESAVAPEDDTRRSRRRSSPRSRSRSGPAGRSRKPARHSSRP